MKKYKLSIEETLKYNREMIIEVPDEMSESEFNKILDKVQRKTESADDISYALEKLNIEVIQDVDSDLSSPSYQEIEIEEYDYIKADGENE